MVRYLQWLIEDQDCDDTRYHTLYALSLARTAIETIDIGLEKKGNDSRNREENISSSQLIEYYKYSVRDRLQLFLQASDLYDPEEILAVIEGSELWLEKVFCFSFFIPSLHLYYQINESSVQCSFSEIFVIVINKRCLSLSIRGSLYELGSMQGYITIL